MEIIKIKRGDTFGFSMALTDNANTPITGKAANLKCQIRDRSNTLVDEMAITESDTLGTYLFRAKATTEWTSAMFFYFDIQYTDADGIVTSSPTVTIELGEDVTKV